MHVPITRLLFGLILVCGIYSTNFAQQMAVGLQDLSVGADVIITGKVTQQSSSWNDDNTRIYTKATIQVDEYLKGINNGSSITVTYLGGEVGDVGDVFSYAKVSRQRRGFSLPEKRQQELRLQSL